MLKSSLVAVCLETRLLLKWYDSCGRLRGACHFVRVLLSHKYRCTVILQRAVDLLDTRCCSEMAEVGGLDAVTNKLVSSYETKTEVGLRCFT